MKKKLKIAYFLDNFYPQVNGVVTSSINTAFEMARRGHEIYGVVSRNRNDLKCPEDYFPFPLLYQEGNSAYFYPEFNYTYIFSAKIVKAILDFKPDIIHFHAPMSMGYQAIRISRILKIPVVGTFHTFFAEPEYLSIVNLDKCKFLTKIGWWYSNQFFNRCDAVISPGKYTAKHLIEKKLKNKLYIISNGVDVKKYQKFKFKPDKFLLNPKKNEEWIIFIGRISKEKCLNVLLDAMKILINRRKKLKLLVVGDGPYKEELKKTAKNMNLHNNVFYSGMIQNKDLLESGILSKMKLFVTPSTSENQPMTILEAIMFGLPVVGVNAKGVPELIEGNGFIVPPGDSLKLAESILKILQNKTLYKKFRNKSLKLSKKYDIRLTTDKIEALYYDLVK